MRFKARQDLIAGLCMSAIGLAAAVHAGLSYTIGSPGNMGPGFFPLCLGLCMLGFGGLIAVFGTRSEPVEMVVEFGPFAAILAAMAVFAITLPLFGLLPACVLLVAVCLLASRPPSPLAVLLTIGGVTAVALLVFKVGLNIRVPVLHWPL